MADAVPNPMPNPMPNQMPNPMPNPENRRTYQPVRAIAAVCIIVAVAILSIAAASRVYPDMFTDAPTGDRAKHGHVQR